MALLAQDFHHALRSLLRRPAFTILVLITLAVGIGASTAIFTVANAVLFRPLPYADPERLVFVWNRLGSTGVEKSPISAPDFADYVDETRLFEGFMGVYTISTAITEDQLRAESINMAWASPNFFSLLGVDLVLGEMYGPEDEGRSEPSILATPGATMPTAPLILSYELWQRRYGGDPGVLGRPVVVNGQSMIIRGVAPQGFRLYLPPDAPIPSRIDAWTPFIFPMRSGSRDMQWINVVARLKPAVTLADAQGEMDALAAMQRQQFEFHKSAGTEIRVIPMHQDVTGHVRSQLLWLLVVGAGLLLLLSFANVTSLLLLRNWERRREVGIRAALGGRPARLAVRVVAESALLAVGGGALGVALAHGGIRLLLLLQPGNLPRVAQAGVDATALAVALAVVLAATLVCALVPAWQSSRIQLAAVLSERSSTGTRAHQWPRKGLVALEIAISLVLLVSSGLVLRSAAGLSRIDPGFRSHNVLTAKVVLPFFKYPAERQRADFYQELVDRAAAIPGVEVAGGVHPLPFADGRQAWFGPWSAEGMVHDEWTKREADYRQTMPGYFQSLGIRLHQGRLLTAADNLPQAPPVVVVDQVMAQRAWPEVEDPVGKRLMIWGYDETSTAMIQVWAKVVGVVDHVRDDDLTRDGKGMIYCPQRFYAFPELSLTLKSATSDPLALVGPLREVLETIDPDLSMINVRPMRDYVDDVLAPTRFALSLIGVFALIAALLAAVGLYGVVSSAVQQRWREIGIRIAFGAEQRRVLRLVLGQALGLTALGLAGGLLTALGLTRGLESLLYGVTATDPLTFAAVAVVQAVIAVVASAVPAWRATRVDPAAVLNTE